MDGDIGVDSSDSCVDVLHKLLLSINPQFAFFLTLALTIQFYTQAKTITSLWRSEDATVAQAQTTMPTVR